MHYIWSLLCHTNRGGCPQGELAIKNADLAVASRSVEEMLKEISQSTAAAEKEKSKVAVIVDDVSKTASARCCVLYSVLGCRTVRHISEPTAQSTKQCHVHLHAGSCSKWQQQCMQVLVKDIAKCVLFKQQAVAFIDKQTRVPSVHLSLRRRSPL